MADLVTGDAVVLELRLARLASRALALAMDMVAQVVALVLVVLILGNTLEDVDPALRAAITLTSSVLVVVGYPVAWETLTRGHTPGKSALGLRVVRDDGGPIRFRHALLRGLTGVVELWASSGSIALFASLISSRGQRLGDMLAGTVVVRERMPVSDAVLPSMPPELAGWAGTLDLSRLSDDLALAVRQYLGRVADLSGDARARMGRRLAEAVAAGVRPDPPAGVRPEAYLTAVIVERRNRELHRLRARTDASSPPASSPPAQPPAASPALPAVGPRRPSPSAGTPDRAVADQAAPERPDNPFAPPG